MANYIRENWSADLDFGTGEWSVGAWVNVPTTLPAENFPTVGSELLSTGISAGVGSPGAAAAYNTVTGEGTATRVDVSNQSYVQFSGFDSSAGYKIAITNTGSVSIAVRTGWNQANLFTVAAGVTTTFFQTGVSTLIFTASVLGTATFTIASIKEATPALIADRAHSSGAKLHLGVGATGLLTATAYDGTTTRTVTTRAAYNTGTWLKAEACYTTDGTLSIRVNGQEVAATRGNPMLTLNNSNAVLTIGNSYNLDAPFPGSLALLKISATVPTAEQSQWMYEQEKQMFRENAQVCLPDSGNIVDLAYDDATDTWIAASASNISEWSGLVRTNVTPVPAGSYSKVSAASGVKLAARTTTSPGVDITIPASNLKEELVKRNEAAAKMSQQLAIFDYTCGFTASTTTGNTAITSVSGLSYPQSYIGAKVTGAGIPADTVVQGVSGTTIYLSKAATATATGVQISFNDYILPVGYEAKTVMQDGAVKQEGSTKTYTRLFDGFKETIRFAVAPSYQAWVQIQATRSVQ